MAKRKKGKSDFNLLYLFLFFIFILFLIFSNFNRIVELFNGSKSDVNQVKVKTIPDNNSILDAIVHTKELLGISENNFRNRVGSDAIYISMGIDKDEMDLNYANMILTGQIELNNGKIHTGKEIYSGSRQRLEVIDPVDSQKYYITLYYNNSNKKNKAIELAIVVDDFGIHNNELLDRFCELNKNLTFSILPNQRYSNLVMRAASKTGHETMIHIPMEPISYPKNNPGPNAIYVHLSKKEIRKRMKRFIKQFPFCVGANNHMGSLATTDEDVMKTVLNVLKEHELYFVDSRTSRTTIAGKVAKEMMLPSITSSLFLDTPDLSNATLENKISQLKYLSQSQNKILVITHFATWERYKYLKKFIERIEKLNFKIVPVSTLLKRDIPDIL